MHLRIATLLLSASLATSAAALDGHMQFGQGPVNQSMGGAGTAAFLDTMGTVAWNPAGSMSFEGLDLDASLEMLLIDYRLSSRIDQDALGPGFPPFDMAGANSSQANDPLLPGFAFVYRGEDAPFAIHAGTQALAGTVADLQLEPLVTPNSNPILTPQAPGGFGFGRIEIDYALLKMPIGASFRVMDNLDVGVTATPSLSWLKLSPASFTAPNDANGDGFATYPTSERYSYEVGGGFQVGVAWRPIERVTVGASFHSPIWFGEHEYKLEDENGGPASGSIDLDAPPVLSLGFAVEPFDGTTIAMDFRGTFFSSVSPFDDVGYNPDGSLAGLGWEDSFGVHLGVQQELMEGRVKLRGGYHFVENPVPDEYAFFNTASPLLSEHHLTAGGTVKINDNLAVNASYYHAFANEIEGPYILPGVGEVPGTSVKERVVLNQFSLGLSLDF